MSRSRNIKPGFFQNDTLAECDPLARILFAGLWCEADRSGRLLDRPKKIKAACLPYDDCDVNALLDQLAARGFIIRYVVETVAIIQVCEFSKHQNPHKKEAESVLPPPEKMQAPCKHHASTVQEPEIPEPARLIPDSGFLIPDSLQEQAPNGEEPPNGGPPVIEKPVDPIWGTGLAFLIRKGIPNETARKLLGKLRKAAGDVKTGAILAQAEAEDISDPAPWLMASASRAANPTKSKTTQFFEHQAERIHDMATRRNRDRSDHAGSTQLGTYTIERAAGVPASRERLGHGSDGGSGVGRLPGHAENPQGVRPDDDGLPLLAQPPGVP